MDSRCMNPRYSPAGNRGDKKNILAVEDDVEIISTHFALLSDRFRFIVKTSGAAAVQYLRDKPDIDLALIDVKLPDISGIEVLKEIKRTTPRTPVIIMTAYGNEQVAVSAFRSGARDYVIKPFNSDELRKRIVFCLSLTASNPASDRKALTSETDSITGNMLSFLRQDRKNRVIQQAIEYIENNFAADISLDRVATAAGLSRFHFSRVFKRTTGSTYQSYLNRVRIEQAKMLLQNDALSVTDAGYAVGYSDLTHFERIFKKLTGVSPSRWRRNSERKPELGNTAP